MIKYENHCCDCAVPAYPCLGDSCPHVNIPIYYCDCCDYDTYAEFDIDGEHYCEDCAKEYLKATFEGLNLSEQADVLEIDIKSLGGD